MVLDVLAKLLSGWEGFEIAEIEEHPIGPTQPVPAIVLYLRAMPDHPKRCSRCGEVVADIHDVTERWVRDLWVFEHEAWHQMDERVPMPPNDRRS